MTVFHVKGGTNAGWRKVLAVRDPNWKCPTCGANLKYYKRCPVDGTARPD
jgi:rubredoxin